MAVEAGMGDTVAEGGSRGRLRAYAHRSAGRRSQSARSHRRPDLQGSRHAVLGDPVSRLGRRALAARQKAAGAPCVPGSWGLAGQRDSDRRPDAGSRAAVAAAEADRTAAQAEDRGRHGLERGGRLSGRRPDEHPCGGVAGRPEKAEAPSLPAGRGPARGAGEGASLRGMDWHAAGDALPGADGGFPSPAPLSRPSSGPTGCAAGVEVSCFPASRGRWSGRRCSAGC